MNPLLLYLARIGDAQRFAVGPTLAAAAERAGWAFECYYDDLRRGRHWGGGESSQDNRGWSSGSLVVGGRHAEQLLWLATRHQIVALGGVESILWPALEQMGAEALVATEDPAALYQASFGRLDLRLPVEAVVVDGSPQGTGNVVVSPYLYPGILAGPARLAVDVSLDASGRQRMQDAGVVSFHGWYVEPGRAAVFPGGLTSSTGDATTSTYTDLTAALAEVHRDWGRGILLGDPDLVGAQLPKARRLRLLPLYGRPQTDVLAAASDRVHAASEPVFGRQFDDRDFFDLAKLGHGLQVLDPDPPFDQAHRLPKAIARTPGSIPLEPSDAQLSTWADEGRVLVTLLLWCGMLRELDLVNRLIDLVAITDLRAGLVVTAETIEHASGPALGLLAAPVERGGVAGRLDLLLASTGRGVCPEALLPSRSLGGSLAEARKAVAVHLPPALCPRGWWPLLDTALVPARPPLVGRERGRLRLRVPPRPATSNGDAASTPRSRRDLQGLAGAFARRTGLDHHLEARRPFDHVRPAAFDPNLAEEVASAGFSYMWTKAGFGTPAVYGRNRDFLALTFTAGNWDGWSPFWTVGAPGDLRRAEHRLLRAARPGWLASTVDSPLFAMSGEVLEHGSTLYRMADLVASGGTSGALVNATPGVIARYARLLDERRLLS